MTTLEPLEKTADLSYLNEKVTHAIEREQFDLALSLAQQGKESAEESHDPDWIKQFEELCLQIIVAINLKKEEEQEVLLEHPTSPQAEDFTVLKGIGESAAQKLTNAGFTSIQQLATATSQEIASLKGFGPATAKKLIESAKSYLDSQNSPLNPTINEFAEIWNPNDTSKEDNSKERNSNDEINNSPTPYEKLLEREFLQEETKIKPIPEPLVEEAEEESEEEEENYDEFEDGELSQIKPKSNQRLDARSQYARLTRDPPLKPRAESQPASIVEPPNKYEEHDDIDMEESIADSYEDPEEEITPEKSVAPNEEIPEEPVGILPEPNLHEKIRSTSSQQEPITEGIPRRITVPPILKDSLIDPQEPQVRPKSLVQEIEHTLNMQQYRLIPNHRFQEITMLSYKILSIAEHKKLLLLLPIRVEDVAKELIVSDTIVNVRKANHDNIIAVQELLDCRDIIEQDIATEGSFFQFLNTYLKLNVTVEKRYGKKPLSMVSGQDQYRILVEPVLHTKIKPYFLEKSIPFAYQKRTNLHVISYETITEFLEFIEMKYDCIERHSKAKPSIQEYRTASSSFNHNLRIASYTVWLYTALLVIMYCTSWFYLLRIFLNLGYAVMGIYAFIILYLSYRFYMVKKEVSNHFSTPYYQQAVHLEEAEQLLLKEEYSEELMEQFEYECLEAASTNSTALEEKLTSIVKHPQKAQERDSKVVSNTEDSGLDDHLHQKYTAFF